MQRRQMVRIVAKCIAAGFTPRFLGRRADAAPLVLPDPPGEGWENIGGQFSCSWLTPLSWGPDRIDLFGIAGDNNAWHKAWRGSQGWDPPDQGWAPIGGSFKPGSTLSLVSWGANVLDVFGIGADGRVWHKAWRGGADWDPAGSDWSPVGGNFSQALSVAAISWGPDRIDLFGIAGDNSAWHKAWRGTQGWDPRNQDWAPIGGSFKPGTVLSATSWGSNVLDVFGIGSDGRVWHKAWRGGPDWDPPSADWAPVGGNFSNSLAVAASSWGPDRIDLVGITGGAGDTSMWHKAWRGTQGWDPPDEGWAPIGGKFDLAQVPSLLSRTANRMDITATAGGGAWSKGWYGGPDWDPAGLGWAYLGGRFKSGTSLTATSWSPERIDLFGMAPDGSVWHKPNVNPAAPPFSIGQEIRLPLNTQETTCAAFPANGGESGQLIITGSADTIGSGNGSSLSRVPLGAPGPVEDLMLQLSDGKLPLLPNGLPDTTAPLPLNTRYLGTDNQTIRTGKYTVLAMKLGGTTMDVTTRPGWWKAQLYKPDWWQDQWGNGYSAPGWRVELALFKSDDRGRTWSPDPVSSIDSLRVAFPLDRINAGNKGDVEIGRSAWPQRAPNGDYGPGGWDRPDAYLCPWTGRLYIHLNSGSGNTQDGHTTGASLLFVSEDGGRSWDMDQDGNLMPRYVFDPPNFFVVAMTSRPNGNFYLFQAKSGETPTLMLSNDAGRTFTQRTVYYTDENGQRQLYQPVDIAHTRLNAQLRNAGTHAMSRSRSGVRIAYCTSISAGAGARQVYELLSVIWDDPVVEPKISSIAELSAEDSSGSVLYATFVETDRIELPTTNQSNAALLYWVETAGTKLRTRGLVMHDDTGWSQPCDLSTRTWEPAVRVNRVAALVS